MAQPAPAPAPAPAPEPSADSVDGRLLSAWREHRDEDAFAELVERHRQAVLAWCRDGLSATPHLADDAAQRVFLVLAQEAAVITDPSGLRPWLATVSRHISATLRRSETRRISREQASARSAVAVVPQVIEGLRAAAREALGQLPDAQRELIDLHLVQGLPREDLAQRLGISLEALHKRMQTARRALQDSFRRLGYQVPACLLVAALGVGASPASAAEPTQVADRRPLRRPRATGSGGLVLAGVAVLVVGAVLLLVRPGYDPAPALGTVAVPTPLPAPAPPASPPSSTAPSDDGRPLLGLDAALAQARIRSGLPASASLSIQERQRRFSIVLFEPEALAWDCRDDHGFALGAGGVLPPRLLRHLRTLGAEAQAAGGTITVCALRLSRMQTLPEDAVVERLVAAWQQARRQLADAPGLSLTSLLVDLERGTVVPAGIAELPRRFDGAARTP